MHEAPIVTITLNPALDLTVRLDHLFPGELNLARDSNLRPAGKGINVAMVLRDLGMPVAVTGILGADNPEAYRTLFELTGMEDHFLAEEGATRINVKLSEQEGRVTDINLPGLTISTEIWERLLEKVRSLCDRARIFVLSGSLPRGLSTERFAGLIKLLKHRGKQVLVDTSGIALEAAVDAGADLIKPNLDELIQWAGRPLPGPEERDQAVAEIRARGVSQVLVSDGPRGLYWYDGETGWTAVPPKVEVVSTVGAGDSLLAGISFALARGLSTRDGLRLATAAAALAVSQIGVGFDDADRLRDLAGQVKLTRLFPVERDGHPAEEDPCNF